MNEPWRDWIPGALSKNQLRGLCGDNYIENAERWDDDDKGPIDYSALDLTLTSEGYRMIEGSVKPFGDRYESQIKSQAHLRQLLRLSTAGILDFGPKTQNLAEQAANCSAITLRIVRFLSCFYAGIGYLWW
jgi:hypothetical protein